MSKQLALVKAKITAIVQSAVAVQPGNHLPRWSAQLPAQGSRGPKETKDWPTALYEQKWLRMPPPGWEPHIRFSAQHGSRSSGVSSQDMHALFEDIGLKFPSKPAPPMQQQSFPRSWADNSRPGHEKLELELLGHIRRVQHNEDFLGISDRWPLMALEVRPLGWAV